MDRRIHNTAGRKTGHASTGSSAFPNINVIETPVKNFLARKQTSRDPSHGGLFFNKNDYKREGLRTSPSSTVN